MKRKRKRKKEAAERQQIKTTKLYEVYTKRNDDCLQCGSARMKKERSCVPHDKPCHESKKKS